MGFHPSRDGAFDHLVQIGVYAAHAQVSLTGFDPDSDIGPLAPRRKSPRFRTFQVCPKDRLTFPGQAPDASDRLRAAGP
jgi:hypothetical protein